METSRMNLEDQNKISGGSGFDERPGWRFDGWFVDEARTMRLNPGANLPHHVTIYDKWVPIEYPVTYRLKYGTNNRRNPRTVSIVKGVSKLFPPIQKDAFFEGWYWKGERVDFLPEGLHEAVELKARFSDVPCVFFETFGGGKIAPKAVTPAGFLQPFKPPLKPGYIFDGWFEDREFLRPFSFSRKIRKNQTLYARWKEKGYTVHYDLDGGVFEEEVITSFDYETPTFWLPKPVRRGYRFVEWQDRRRQPVTSIPTHTMMDKHVKAIWQKNEPEVHAMKRRTSSASS